METSKLDYRSHILPDKKKKRHSTEKLYDQRHMKMWINQLINVSNLDCTTHVNSLLSTLHTFTFKLILNAFWINIMQSLSPFLELDVFETLDFHIWQKQRHILQNIFFCVPQKKKSNRFWVPGGVSKWWDHFHFWWTLHFEVPICTIRVTSSKDVLLRVLQHQL